MEYKILTAKGPLSLEDAVQKSIERGWRPQGGIAICAVDNAIWFHQAISRIRPIGDLTKMAFGRFWEQGGL